MIWGVAVGLSFVVFGIMLNTLRGANTSVVNHQDGAVAIHADQLLEIDRDLAAGLISQDEATAAKVEIKRRLLRLNKVNETALNQSSGAGLLIVMAVFVPAVAFGLYGQLGSPDTPAMPFAERQDERAQENQIVELTERLRRRLLQSPDGGETQGWMMLGQTYMRMGRFDDAVESFERLQDRPDVGSDNLSRYAEALIANENGLVTPQAKQVLDRAYQMDPLNPAAAYYRAVALEQAGQEREAYDLLRGRIETEVGFQPWMETFSTRLNALAEKTGQEPIRPGQFASSAPGPSQEQVEAAAEMSDDDRNDFIRSMVTRLAQRLESEPEDLKGWLRLGNAYKVLGDNTGARNAYTKAVELTKEFPESHSLRQAAIQGLEDLGGS